MTCPNWPSYGEPNSGGSEELGCVAEIVGLRNLNTINALICLIEQWGAQCPQWVGSAHRQTLPVLVPHACTRSASSLLSHSTIVASTASTLAVANAVQRPPPANCRKTSRPS